ncbi:PAS domain-containing protein [Dongia mobilis]|nr:PAS domain-containing protein [Dongia mobilis]
MLAPMTDSAKPGPNIAALLAHWQALGGGSAPTRAQFDPMAVPRLLPHIYVVEFETRPFRVRYRLTGTKADEWNGFNITGRYIDEFLVDDKFGANRILLDTYETAWRTGQPAIATYHWPTRTGFMVSVGFGVFPLTVNGIVAQALAIEDIGTAPKADEWVPFEDPAKKT